MYEQFDFHVVFGPVDDFEKVPSGTLSIYEIRRNAIEACIEAFKKEVEKRVSMDQSIISYGPIS